MAAWATLLVAVVFLRSNGLRLDWRTVQYTVPVELPGYVYQWHFVAEHAGPVF